MTACDAEIQDEIDRVFDVGGTGPFAHLRSAFDEIAFKVISQHGMLSVSANSEGHTEFKAEVSGRRGMSTNQDGSEIALRPHDDGDGGRPFKIPEW